MSGKLLIFLILSGLLLAQPISISVTPAHNRAVIYYTPPSTAACTVEVSTSPTYSPLIADVDSAQFTGSNLDSRAGTVKAGGRTAFVAGTPIIAANLSSINVSRALQADTTYYYRITCGSAVTGQFHTSPTPLGASYPCIPQYLSGSFGNVASPTIDWTDQTKIYTDPCSGVGWKRISGENEATAYGLSPTPLFAFSLARDVAGAAWTTPQNVLGSAGFASTAAIGVANSLSLSTAPAGDQSLQGFQTNHAVTGLMISINGSGTTNDNVLSACVAKDDGQTCYGKQATVGTLPLTTPSVLQYPATWVGEGGFTNWLNAGQIPIGTDMIMIRTGSLSTNGTAATLLGGLGNFADLAIGQSITLSSCTGAGNGTYTISAVVNYAAITLGSTAGVNASCSFTAFPFSVKIWKSAGTGTISINTAKLSYMYESQPINAFAGFYPYCSNTPAVDFNGISGWACSPFLRPGGAGRQLYWIGQDGSSRLIARGTVTITGDARDQVAGGLYLPMTADPTNPSVWWGIMNTGGNVYVGMIKCIYNAADVTYGGWRNWSAATPTTGESSAWSCTNVTKASLGQDLRAQIIALAPQCDMSVASAPMQFLSIDSTGHIMISYAGQDLPGCIASFNTSTALVDHVWDTWSTWPMRWTANHSPAEPYGAGIWNFRAKPMGGNWTVAISSVTGTPGPGTAVSNSYFDARTCEAMGVVDSRWIALGATGHSCIEAVITGDPLYAGAPAWMVTKWGAGAPMSTLQPGDFVYDSVNYLEKFLVAARSGQTIVLQRANTSYGINNTGGTYISALQAHSNGWSLTPVPPSAGGSVAGGAVLLNSSTGAAATVDYISMAMAHSDAQTRGDGTTTVVESGYYLRDGTPAAQSGQPPTWTSNSYSATFGCGASCSTYVGTGVVIQSHPTAQNPLSPSPRTAFDGKPMGGISGLVSQYHNVVTTAVTNVYKVSAPFWDSGGTQPVNTAWDPKTQPPTYWAGRYVLLDISGPGSSLLTGDAWKACRAYQAGECVAASLVGDTFMNVPQAFFNTGTTTPCSVATFGQFEPCWTTPAQGMFNLLQIGIDRTDATGSNWRQLGSDFLGHSFTNGFWQPRPTPDGKVLLTNGGFYGYKWLTMGGLMPTYPALSSINRNQFIPTQISIYGGTGISVRVEFGYSEYDRGQLATSGVPRCSQYNDICYAGGAASPYNYSFEAAQRTTCTTFCAISIPAIPARVLYYRVLRWNGVSETIDPVQVAVVP